MNFSYFNKVIEYIENNLDNEIDFQVISKITGVNDFIFQRIFVFLTNMTLTDYIKKRRLSKAYEEIKNTNQKILAIAVKYQYNSAQSFNRAFKKTFGITPTECRSSTKSYQLIPAFYFKQKEENDKYNFNYDIEKINDIKLYCYHEVSDDYENLTYKIRKLYKRLKQTDVYDNLNKYGRYGIFSKFDNKYHYFVGSKKENKDLDIFTIKKGKYAVFKLYSKEQKDIIDLENNIYNKWFLSTNYSVGDNDNFELYDGDICYIYISIK